MRCIGVINQKGGCGKTTISMNLAACLAEQGQRTLLVDMDPQNHCAVGLAVPEEQIENNIYDVLISVYSKKMMPLKNIVWQISQNFDLAPSGIELAALEPQLAGKDHREDSLRTVLSTVADQYDFVIIDCPPSVGLLTFNALRASDEVIIPVETGYFALHGLTRQLETLNVLKQQCQQSILFRILASMYDVRTKLAREVLNELKKHHQAQMFDTVINFNTKLKEAASFGQPISEYDSASKGMKDFMALATELVESDVEVSITEQVIHVDQKIEEITKSANQLLEESELLLGTKPEVIKEEIQSIQDKIDLFYGVRQNHDNIEFTALYPKAESVKIAGDFNGWDPEQTELTPVGQDGRWAVELPLDQGRYRYRYVVDGRWMEDPHNSDVEMNEFGDYNSVLEVK